MENVEELEEIPDLDESTGTASLVRTLSVRNRKLQEEKNRSSPSLLLSTLKSKVPKESSLKRSNTVTSLDTSKSNADSHQENDSTEIFTSSLSRRPTNWFNKKNKENDHSTTSNRLRANTMSSTPSISSPSESANNDKISRKKFAEAKRALDWGIWKKGIELMDALDREGDPRAKAFLDPLDVTENLENPTGCYYIGKHFEEKEEYVTALAWYGIGAQGGFVLSQIEFANLLSLGKGTDGAIPNPGLAMKWYYKAFLNQNPTPTSYNLSAYAIGCLYINGDPSISAASNPIKWASLSDIEASSYTVIPQDLQKGTNWIRKSASRNHAEAKDILSSLSDINPHIRYAEAVENMSRVDWRVNWKKGIETIHQLAQEGFEAALAFIDPATTSLVTYSGAQWFGVWDFSAAESEGIYLVGFFFFFSFFY